MESKNGEDIDLLMQEAALKSKRRFESAERTDSMDAQMGFQRYTSPMKRKGWLINAQSMLMKDPEWIGGRSAVDLYFIEDDGGYFKSTVIYSPYFYIRCRRERETEEFLRKKFERLIEKMECIDREDLDLPNHLIGLKRTYLKLSFRNVNDLLTVRKAILSAVEKNKERLKEFGGSALLEEDTFLELAYEGQAGPQGYQGRPTGYRRLQGKHQEIYGFENILDIREYDVPYHLRVCIDLDIRVGLWYVVWSLNGGTVTNIERLAIQPVRPDPVVLAFDIETTKLPLKFPDPTIDAIMMISYMIDGRGYLIVNREIVSQDIDDFEYTPKPEYQGLFSVFNERNERALLVKFYEHIQHCRPTVIVTYNGDFFDWPFVEARTTHHGLDMKELIGFQRSITGEEYESSYAIHMDAYRWVKRDSYLPQGSQGLKAVTAIKLGYAPLEIDPEDMLRFAAERPQDLASYSVSDALCTYHLYMKYIHPFIFSLCNIIPLNPDEVLRKGSGTLCETLLMAESQKAAIIMPNKHVDEPGKLFEGHLLESETYVGGHVESLASGVFRQDIPAKFTIPDPRWLQAVIADVDEILQFALQHEVKVAPQNVTNYEVVLADLRSQLQSLAVRKTILEKPLIYHLDVAAMYPNIMLTNRLQPPSIVTEQQCAVCDYNRPGKTCQRKMTWMWRGEYFVAKKNELKMITNQLESERFPIASAGRPFQNRAPNRFQRSAPSQYFPRPSLPSNLAAGTTLPYEAFSLQEKNAKLKQRLTQYCKKVYKKVHETKVIERESIVCMKENSFYVDTVRLFRDRRYDFKTLLKDAKKALEDALASRDALRIGEAKKTIVLYDSLQLAHKCILNSFYGYVMRKGSRWYSMEMAGIVCNTGAAIIRLARQWVERLGARPLELDTDGIWCMFPSSFPDTIHLNLSSGKTVSLSFPCALLNRQVHADFTNHQYETLVTHDFAAMSLSASTLDVISRPPANLSHFKKYVKSSENSIFFEIDGPYRAMILPASVDEDRLLKKRYAVYNDDGTLAELKGFEVKRRGELQLTKVFQTQLFDAYLLGRTLVETYAEAALIANRWLDMLLTKGAGMSEHALFELLSERKTMSKSLQEYGQQKSTAISTARRLMSFLGDDYEGGSRGALSCEFVIIARPYGHAVAQRAIPTAIFSAEPLMKRHYLRLWLGDDASTGDVSSALADILDWQYYTDRFISLVQKLITLPAAFQGIENPVPRVPYPDWMKKRFQLDDAYIQRTLISAVDPLLKLQESSSKEHHLAVSEVVPLSERVDFRSESQRALDDKKAAELAQEKAQEDRLLSLVGVIKLKSALYREWLQVYKLHWKKERRLREASHPKSKSLFGLFRSPTQDKKNAFLWQNVAQLVTLNDKGFSSTLDSGGPLDAWIVYTVGSGFRLKRLSLQVPFTFYLHLRDATLATELASRFKKSQLEKLIDRPTQHLLQVALTDRSEDASLWKPLRDAEIWKAEGIYEDTLSREKQTVMAHGVCIGMSKTISTTSRSITNASWSSRQEWNSHEWAARRDLTAMYLKDGEKGSCILSPLFLASVSSSSGKSLIVLYNYQRAGCSSLTIWVQDATGLHLTDATARDLACQYLNFGNFQSPDNLTIAILHAKKDWQKQIKKYIEANILQVHDHPPFLLLYSLDTAKKELKSYLDDKFPLLAMPTVGLAGTLLGDRWVVEALQKSMEKGRLLLDEHVGIFQRILALSRLAHVPLSSFSFNESTAGVQDPWIAWQRAQLTTALDMLLLRQWKFARYIIPTPTEDTGMPSEQVSFDPAPIAIHGGPSVHCLSILRSEDAGRDLIRTTSLADVFNQPGTFTTVCFDLQLSGVVLNAILNSNHAAATTMHTSVTSLSAPQSVPEDSQATAWMLLQQTVASLCQSLIQQKIADSDLIVAALHPWLQSSPYCISVRTMLLQAVQSTLAALRRYCASLGATVIYLSESRLVLATKKKNWENAKAFLEYLISGVNNAAATGISLSWITLSIKAAGRNILWCNPDNFYWEEIHAMYEPDRVNNADLEAAASDSIGTHDLDSFGKPTGGNAEENFEVSLDGPSFVYRWQLAEERLPTSLQDAFFAILSEFIHIVAKEEADAFQEKHAMIKNKKWKKLAAKMADGQILSQGLFSEPDHPSVEKSLGGMSGEDIYSSDDADDLDDPPTNLQSAEDTEDIPTDSVLFERKRAHDATDSASFTKSLPSDFTMRLFKLLQEVQSHYFKSSTKDAIDTPLALTQLLVGLFALEPRYHVHARSLRKQWLHSLNIPEFADAATFKATEPLLLLKNIECPACMNQIFFHVALYSNQALSQLACPACQKDVPLSTLTELAIRSIKATLLADGNRDVHCRRCHLPREFPLLKFCPNCKGEPYVPHESQLKRKIENLRTIAWLPNLQDFLTPHYFK